VGKSALLAPRGLIARCQQWIVIPSACSVACHLLYFLASLQVAIELADAGYTFLAAYSPTDLDTKRLMNVARRFRYELAHMIAFPLRSSRPATAVRPRPGAGWVAWQAACAWRQGFNDIAALAPNDAAGCRVESWWVLKRTGQLLATPRGRKPQEIVSPPQRQILLYYCREAGPDF